MQNMSLSSYTSRPRGRSALSSGGYIGTRRSSCNYSVLVRQCITRRSALKGIETVLKREKIEVNIFRPVMSATFFSGGAGLARNLFFGYSSKGFVN